MHKGIEPVSLSREKMGRKGWCDGGARLLIRDGREHIGGASVLAHKRGGGFLGERVI